MADSSSSSSPTRVTNRPQQLLPLTEGRAAGLSPPMPPSRDQFNHLIRALCGSRNDGSVGPGTFLGPDMSDWPWWKHEERLWEAALYGKWEIAKEMLDWFAARNVTMLKGLQIQAVTLSLVGGRGETDFITQLLKYLKENSLISIDAVGWNVLHFAAMIGQKEVAKLLVDGVPDLVYGKTTPLTEGLPVEVAVTPLIEGLPVHVAAMYGEREVLEYLMTKTSWDQDKMHNGDVQLLRLFRFVVVRQYFDIALYLIEKHPEIAKAKETGEPTALGILAKQASVFSGQEVLFNPGEGFLRIFSQIKSMMMKGENVNKRKQASELVRRVCKAIISSSPQTPRSMVEDAMTAATVVGSHEVVELILKMWPCSLFFSPDDTPEPTSTAPKQKVPNLIYKAVEVRCEGVFNLVYRVRGCRQVFRIEQDKDGNHLLHAAAKLSPAHKLNQVSGAALQMQRELQWYKEVERLVPSFYRCLRNNVGITPQELFTEEHKDLKKAGEKWMRDTAKSCSFAAVLIVTIMFAAAITVPGGSKNDSGGNKDEIGFPIFSGDGAFMVFAIADAVSLFASSTSLLVFLSILTSSFPEESFLRYHPTVLIAGLGTLFLSIASMIVAFAATVFLVLARKTMWILAPTSAVACLGVGSFAFLQLPLLYELVHSTCGPGIFNKKAPPIF